MLKEHQRARETVASSLGWKQCGKLQSSSAKQERGKEANGTNKKILLSASVKNLLKALAHTPSFLSVSQQQGLGPHSASLKPRSVVSALA